jgi:hypothetical protein
MNYKPLRIPGDDEFVKLTMPVVNTDVRCGTHVYIPERTREVSLRYATYEDGSLAANLTQKQVAELLDDY